jgi:hypothetical protein
MGGACNMHRREVKCVRNLSKTPNRIDNLRNQGADGRIILNWILMTRNLRILIGIISLSVGAGGCYCKHGNNVCVPPKTSYFRLHERLTASQGLCSVKLDSLNNNNKFK